MCVAWKPIENTNKTQLLRRTLWKTRGNTQVLRRNRWKPKGKHVFYVRANGKRKENTGLAWEHIKIYI